MTDISNDNDRLRRYVDAHCESEFEPLELGEDMSWNPIWVGVAFSLPLWVAFGFTAIWAFR